jgi:modification methylase
VAAKLLHRNWIGIEKEKKYIEIARKRIDAVEPEKFDLHTFDVKSKAKSAPKVEFSALVENGYLQPGQSLFFRSDPSKVAYVKPDATTSNSRWF